MPFVKAQGKTVACSVGENLRQVLLQHGVDLYNGAATVINCHSLGTCGTCAVVVEGHISPLTWKEKTRLSLPPHAGANLLQNNRRLACQVKVLGDITVTKYDQFWGQGDAIAWSADPLPQENPGPRSTSI
jgi:ferredoxin